MKLFLILVLHLRQFFIVRIFVKRATEDYLAISRSSSASKSVEFIWAEIYWGRLFFRVESSLIQRAVVPYEISKVNFRVETKFLVSMSEEI